MSPSRPCTPSTGILPRPPSASGSLRRPDSHLSQSFAHAGLRRKYTKKETPASGSQPDPAHPVPVQRLVSHLVHASLLLAGPGRLACEQVPSGDLEDTIDIGGRDFARTRKFHNAQRNPNVALVVDDVLPPWRPRCVLIRGRAEALADATGPDGEPAGPIIW